MEWWHAVILGIVEGITEYLPISSTGHLIITSSLLGLDEGAKKSAVDAFNIVIQGGAILAVLLLYWPRAVQMVRGLLGKDAGGRRLFLNLLIAFVPAAVLGPLLDDWIESRLFDPMPVLAALALGGVWMIWLDWRSKRRAAREESIGTVDTADAPARDPLTEMSWKTALGIGLFQVVAMWPGTSRSMMTIAGGTLLGMKPKHAAEFSFLLGLPTLGGACVFKLTKNLYESSKSGEPNMLEQLGAMPIVLGVVTATVSAMIAVKWLVGFLNKHGLAPFGWYRLALCAVMGALILGGAVSF